MRQKLRGWSGAPVLLAAALVAACSAPTKTEVSQGPGLPASPLAGGGVVLFRGSHDQPNASEATFIRCLRGEFLERLPPPLTLVDTSAFQDALFPWFEPENAPRTVEELNSLLARPLIRGRIASLGVRYLFVISSAARSDGFPGMICGAGYGGGGCLGVAWEDKTHRAQAVVWDLAQGTQAGSLGATSTGKSVGFAFVIPILFLADTEGSACQALASELVRLLTDPADFATIGQ